MSLRPIYARLSTIIAVAVLMAAAVIPAAAAPGPVKATPAAKVTTNTLGVTNWIPLDADGWTSPSVGVEPGPMPYKARSITSTGGCVTQYQDDSSVWPSSLSIIELDYTLVLPTGYSTAYANAVVQGTGDNKVVVNGTPVIGWTGVGSACTSRTGSALSALHAGSNTIQVFSNCNAGSYCSERWIDFSLTAYGDLASAYETSPEADFAIIIAKGAAPGPYTYDYLACDLNVSVNAYDTYVVAGGMSEWLLTKADMWGRSNCSSFPLAASVVVTQSAMGTVTGPTIDERTSLINPCGNVPSCDVRWSTVITGPGIFYAYDIAEFVLPDANAHFVTAQLLNGGIAGCYTPIINGHTLICEPNVEFVTPSPI